MDREFDLVVFGASGFTGQFVVEEVARSWQKDQSFKWAISGRSAKKLEQVLKTATEQTGIDVKGVTIIEADINDEESIKAMTRRTRLVLNCVGPYRFYGEQVVKSCVETATNHLDISGEPQYMESMQVKYDKAAKEKGIYIISACGWDSIPCDLGTRFLKRNFNGELNAVETFMRVRTGPQGVSTNYGTWLSAIHGFATAHELGAVRRRLYTEIYTKKRPRTKFKLERKTLPFKSEHVGGEWCLPFPGSDRSVVQRTEQYNYETRNERPTQIETYWVTSFLYMLGTILVGAVFGTMASFRWGRSLLEAHPKFFSFGMFTKEGPTREQLRDTTFTMTLVGRGWADKLSEPTDEPNDPPNKTMTVVVKGKDPGYVSTSTCLVQAGITLLKDKLPPGGGVFTPGAAFQDTGIYERLRANELTIDVVTSDQ